MLCSLATLKQMELDAIQDFEKKTGRTLLAFACRDIDVEEVRDDKFLKELRELEDRLCLSLVAVKK